MTRKPGTADKFSRSALALALLSTLATLAAVDTLARAPVREMQLAARAGAAPVAAAPAQQPKLYSGRVGDRRAAPTPASVS